MGLDSYLYITSERPIGAGHLVGSHNEIAYWRKYRDLNREMYRLAEKKGGELDLGQVLVDLDADDLDSIECYFDTPERLEAYKEARDALRNGQFVYYWGSW